MTNYHRIKTVDNFSDIHLEAKRFIDANYDKHIVLSDFTKAKGYSTRQTQRALSFHDTTWLRMVLDVRMQRSKELLANSGESIVTVAERVGYSPSQFSRTFKAEEGMTPEEYRTWIQSQ